MPKPVKDDYIAFKNVNVITMDSPIVSRGYTVLISGGIIKEVGIDIKLPLETKIIDGSGKYLIPGLVDMHVHVSHYSDLTLFVANGVISVRNMWGTGGLMKTLGFMDHLKLKKQISSDNLLAPTMFTAGSILNEGSLFMKNVVSEDQAEKVVQEHLDKGFDFVKVYDDLSPEIYNAILDTARQKSIRVAGHVPRRVSLSAAIQAGQISIEHLTGFLDYDAAKLLVPKTDLPAYAIDSRENDVFICPTIVMAQRRTWHSQKDLPELKYVPSRTRMLWWLSLAAIRSEVRAKYDESSNGNYIVQVTDLMKQTTNSLHKNGAKMILGTDAGNPFVIPGFSTLYELENLVDAGLTPFEALKSATVNAAECLGKDTEFGQVKKGLIADLLLLENNPLISIRNVRKQVGVMVRGKWITNDEIKVSALTKDT